MYPARSGSVPGSQTNCIWAAEEKRDTIRGINKISKTENNLRKKEFLIATFVELNDLLIF
jgi:hypothetical protein